MPKLIILRGPSGSGKSTVARKLQRINTHAIAVIEQDYYKEVMFYPKDTTQSVRHEMIFMNAKLALDHGCDVILDGIFANDDFKARFEELMQYHPQENYAFYFDVSLDETFRRHATRPQKNKFGEKHMREWYPGSVKTRYSYEKVVPEDFTLEQALFFVREETGI